MQPQWVVTPGKQKHHNTQKESALLAVFLTCYFIKGGNNKKKTPL